MAKNISEGWLGVVLGEIRRGRQLSLDTVAERVGVSRQTVANWEANVSSPAFTSVIKLARALQVSPRVFLPPDPVTLAPPAWQTIAVRLGLTYDEALRLRSLLADAGIAETATPEQAVLVWMREIQVLQ
ncbi:MAG: helix-turn-helix domain-containing protein [Chloroflexota bacterium]|nr:helix-turn-helix domain-containing protein [Chloroflexota bacterium]